MEQSESLAVAQSSIKRAIKEVSWWKLVKEEIQNEIQFLIDNIHSAGIPFCKAFRASCSLNLIRREILGTKIKDDESSIIFGDKMSEEVYQASKEPVLHLLRLAEWTDISEADVQACRLLCDHIDILIHYGVLTEKKDSTVADMVEKAVKKTKSKKEHEKKE